MRAVALYAVASAAIIGVAAAVLLLAFGSEAGRTAVWTSAAVAYVVQLFGFAVARASIRSNLMAGWGLGMVLRFVVLAVYALAIVKALALAPTAALVSLATFFFLSTLVEPLLLKP